MTGTLTVKPNKNEFLLYSMLNTLGLARGNPDSHFLRRKTIDHFAGYQGKGLKQEEYLHHSKPVGYVLTLNEVPDLSEKSGLTLNSSMQKEIEFGRAVLSHLKHFYENTDFEDFYQEILPIYQEICGFLQGVLDKSKINEVLDEVWEVDKPFNMEVIPMPLEANGSGIGPSVEDTAYQIVGPSFDYTILRLVAHEGSHPRAKRILEPIKEEIAQKQRLLKKALAHPNYPDSYHYWPTCFEEHFIRAMQQGIINPILGIDSFYGPSSSIEDRLDREENGKGMIFIRDFHDEIQKYKENQVGNLQQVALNILERLDNIN